MSSTVHDLRRIFEAGRKAAIAADPGADADGGTCNFDTPTLRAPRVRLATIEKAAAEAGVHVNKFSSWGASCFWVSVGLNGQGARRTKMAEAASEAMRETLATLDRPEWSVSMYYAMD